MDRNYYMVRVLNNQFNYVFNKSVVAVGWSAVNFSDYCSDPNALFAKIDEEYCYHEIAPQVRGKRLGAVNRFMGIKRDDIIVVPYYSSVRFAKSLGNFVYDAEATKGDIANQLQVQYLKSGEDFLTIPRNILKEGFQRRLRVPGSIVFDLYEFGEEIEKFIAHPDSSFDLEASQKEEEEMASFKKMLRQNICNGDTYLPAGGVGLERLVEELFKCEGYEAKILSKKNTKGLGDVDVQAEKSDGFSSINIIAQVKHHSGESNDWGIHQLDEAKSQYPDSSLVFITSGNVTPERRKFAEDRDVAVVDGDGLVNLIYDNIKKLSLSTLRTLGVSTVPHIIK